MFFCSYRKQWEASELARVVPQRTITTIFCDKAPMVKIRHWSIIKCANARLFAKTVKDHYCLNVQLLTKLMNYCYCTNVRVSAKTLSHCELRQRANVWNENKLGLSKELNLPISRADINLQFLTPAGKRLKRLWTITFSAYARMSKMKINKLFHNELNLGATCFSALVFPYQCGNLFIVKHCRRWHAESFDFVLWPFRQLSDNADDTSVQLLVLEKTNTTTWLFISYWESGST